MTEFWIAEFVNGAEGGPRKFSGVVGGSRGAWTWCYGEFCMLAVEKSRPLAGFNNRSRLGPCVVLFNLGSPPPPTQVASLNRRILK